MGSYFGALVSKLRILSITAMGLARVGCRMVTSKTDIYT
jgi:hypothetical protein